MYGVATYAQHLRLQERMRVTRSDMNRLTLESSSGTYADYYGGLGGQVSRGMAMRGAYQRNRFLADSASVAQQDLASQQATTGQIKDLGERVRDMILAYQSSAEVMTPKSVSEGASGYLSDARAALSQATGGRFLFGGPATDTKPLRGLNEVAPSGLHPQGVIDDMKAAYDLTSVAGMNGFLTEWKSMFDGTHADPDKRFANLFYAGAAGGTMDAVIDQGVDVSLDVRATDEAFTTVLSALQVLDSVGVAETSTDSFAQMARVLSDWLTEGISRTVDLSATIGYRQQVVRDTLDRHDEVKAILNNNLSELESVDDYEVATKLASLQSQMQITYTLTARMNDLSLANYM